MFKTLTSFYGKYIYIPQQYSNTQSHYQRRVITSLPKPGQSLNETFSTHQKIESCYILTIHCCFFVSIARLNNNNNMNNFRRLAENEMKILSLPMIQSNLPASFRPIDYERFKAKFGVTVTVCTITWNMVVSKLNRYPCIKGNHLLGPSHLL